MKLTKKNVFVVIPAYNEGDRIREVLRGVNKLGFSAIVVDDGSTDNTSKVASMEGVHVLRHRINLGKGASLKTGAEAAFTLGASAVVALDADGQHNPIHISKFIKGLEKTEIVFGTRQLAQGAPLVRFVGNKAGASIINFLFGIKRDDLLCGYLAFTSETYKKIKWESARYGVETEIVARTGKNKLKYTEVKVDTIYIDKYKGVSILDAISILPSVFKWRFLN
jgi:glycosyltransferase involved in cell wall biosynthesis